MATIADNAILTVDDWLEITGKSPADAPPEDQTIKYLNQASQQIETWLGRVVVSPSAAIQEIFDGDGSNEYHVRNMLIQVGSEPTLYYWDTAEEDWSGLEPTYTLYTDNAHGKVYFRDYSFCRGTRNWRLDYLPGWTYATVPEDIRDACSQLVLLKRMRLSNDNMPKSSASMVGQSFVSFNWRNAEADILERLRNYRRVLVG
jgi:hypothetical protein